VSAALALMLRVALVVTCVSCRAAQHPRLVRTARHGFSRAKMQGLDSVKLVFPVHCQCYYASHHHYSSTDRHWVAYWFVWTWQSIFNVTLTGGDAILSIKSELQHILNKNQGEPVNYYSPPP